MGRRAFIVVAVALASSIGYFVSGPSERHGSADYVANIRSVAVNDGGALTEGAGRLELNADCENRDQVALLVNPRTLKFSPTQCDSLPIGEDVGIEQIRYGGLNQLGDCVPATIGVRAVVGSAGAASTPVGPVLFRFAGLCSWTEPDTAYTGSSLWVYDCTTGADGNEGTAIELSGKTGALQTSVAMPSVCMTTFGADDAGMVVGSFDLSGSIYFVPTAGRAATVRLRSAGRLVWAVGVGDDLYIDISSASAGCAPIACGVWRLRGSALPGHPVSTDTALGEIAHSPVSDGGSHLFATQRLGVPTEDEGSRWALDVLDVDSGELSRLATLRSAWDAGPPQLAYLDGAIYALFDQRLYRYGLN